MGTEPSVTALLPKKEVAMKKMMGFLLCSALVLSAGASVAAGNENGTPGTVNYFTPAQQSRAFRAATEAGYTPVLVEAFQDGNFFLTARKGGQSFAVTVTAAGQVYPSAPTPAS
jgi:hypothetical protein